VLIGGDVEFSTDWRGASHNPTGLAPDPAIVKEAVIQVYAARSFSWRGAFGVHMWIAAKPENAEFYTRYELVGWKLHNSDSALSISNTRAADAQWYNAKPWVIKEFRGEAATIIMANIEKAAESYPYKGEYGMWPGPNSNTFIAHMARELPGLQLDLPPTAIGKDYLPNGAIFMKAPSGTGYQFSLFGLFGIIIAVEEGIEINILSLVIGLDINDMAIKLPGIGKIG